MVVHYGRQAEPDGRISKQPIVYINHTNRTCPQLRARMRRTVRRWRPAPLVKGLRDAATHAPEDAAAVAGDAPRP